MLEIMGKRHDSISTVMEADKSEVHKGEIKKKTVMHDFICIDCIGIAHEIKT